MIINRLTVSNYSVFDSASFDLSTNNEQPIVLVFGNNGAGKTSLLDAFRLALHGRRAFIDGIAETEYIEAIKGKFHNGRTDRPCSIQLDFEYAEFGSRRNVRLVREWTFKGSRLRERLEVLVDNVLFTPEQGDELLSNLIPPEILKYFFFDGEQVKELADWSKDEYDKLFFAVDQLLGLTIVDQLLQDLNHVSITRQKNSDTHSLSNMLVELEQAEHELKLIINKKQLTKAKLRSASRAYSEKRERFLTLGGLVASERSALESRVTELKSKLQALEDDLRRECSSYLPLLLMRQTRASLVEQINIAAQLETAQAVANALEDSTPRLTELLSKNLGLTRDNVQLAIGLLRSVLLPKPVAVSTDTLSLSLREISWMESVLSSELGRLRDYIGQVVKAHRSLSAELTTAESQLRKAPMGDKKTEGLLCELEQSHQELLALEKELQDLEQAVAACTELIMRLKSDIKRTRQDQFQNKRLAHQERLLAALANALPDYSNELRQSKERQFEGLLASTLTKLWHKKNRVSKVQVGLLTRELRIFHDNQQLNILDLSAAEKQLLATAFIYSVARLSNRNLPFVIDTPVGRLDRSHRRNFVVNFLPTMSHQVILFSTDTEIVGALFRELQPLISRTYDLAEYNNAITMPVQLEVAL